MYIMPVFFFKGLFCRISDLVGGYKHFLLSIIYIYIWDVILPMDYALDVFWSWMQFLRVKLGWTGILWQFRQPPVRFRPLFSFS